MEISFVTVNVPHRRVASALSLEFLLCLVLKKNQFNIIFVPKTHILRWHFQLPFNPIRSLYFWHIFKQQQEKKKILPEAGDRGAQSCCRTNIFSRRWAFSGGCVRRRNLRTECREHWQHCASEIRSAICKSHDSQPIVCPSSPSGPYLPQGMVGQLSELQQCSETSIKKQLWSFLWYRSPGKRPILNGRGSFTKGLENSVLLTDHHSRTTLEKSHL